MSDEKKPEEETVDPEAVPEGAEEMLTEAAGMLADELTPEQKESIRRYMEELGAGDETEEAIAEEIRAWAARELRPSRAQ